MDTKQRMRTSSMSLNLLRLTSLSENDIILLCCHPRSLLFKKRGIEWNRLTFLNRLSMHIKIHIYIVCEVLKV